MRRRIDRFGMIISLLCVLVLFTGCATTSQQSSARPAPKVENASPQVVTVTNQPAWLLIGDKDVSDSRGGDIIRIGGRVTLFPFGMVSYNPKTDPVTVTFWSGGRIVYWKGKGEITNVSTGERVLVPLEK